MAKKSELLTEIDSIQESLSNCIGHNLTFSELWNTIIKKNDIAIDWSAEYLTIYGNISIVQRQPAYHNDIGWDKSWLVIADAISNPFILDTKKGNILYAKHGTGHWVSVEVSDSIEKFLSVIKLYMETYYIDFQENILDETYEINNDFMEALKSKLHKICTKDQTNNFIGSILG